MRIAAIVAACLFTSYATADIAPGPSPRPPQPTPQPPVQTLGMHDFTVKVDDTIREPKIYLPRALFQAGNRRGALDAADGDDTRLTEATPNRLPIAGLFLTAALVAGGLWFARTKSRKVTTWAVVVTSGVLLAGAATLMADLPPRPVPPSSPAQQAQSPLQGEVRIGGTKVQVIVQNNLSTVTLVLPPGLAADLGKVAPGKKAK